MRIIISFIVAILLSACGGGGSDSSTTNAITKRMNGAFSVVSGSITPDPATSAQQLQVQFTAHFTGNFAPTAGSFTVPFTVTRTTNGQQVTAGEITFNLTTGQAGNGDFAGNGSVVLPVQPVGVQNFCVQITPATEWTFNGTVLPQTCTNVTINP